MVKLREFQGFFQFWNNAKAIWSLGEALEIFHNRQDAWMLLDRKLKELKTDKEVNHA